MIKYQQRIYMAEALSFEAKVQGLVDYYHALEELDPKNPDHSEAANPDFFYYAEGHHASYPLREVKAGVLYDIECHARSEYSHFNGRGFNLRDLREDTDELRAERADILAVMTAPVVPEVRQERAERIAGLLADISTGKTVKLAWHGRSLNRHVAPQETTFDVTRAMFGVFTNGHISDRNLTIQYDTPVYFSHSGEQVGEQAMRINIPGLFRPDELLVETIAA
jgi:hypothetical protein